ncbi:MAG: transposase, partial [Anaerolineaceae bacterium]|nr:transposase [Anaerolineaceae bacterium]
TPLSLAEARRLVSEFVAYYNSQRLHSAIGYITPADMLAGRQAQIWSLRHHKLDQARQARQRHWQQQLSETLVAEAENKLSLPEQSSLWESLI